MARASLVFYALMLGVGLPASLVTEGLAGLLSLLPLPMLVLLVAASEEDLLPWETKPRNLREGLVRVPSALVFLAVFYAMSYFVPFFFIAFNLAALVVLSWYRSFGVPACGRW
jgi:hypothetical protein